MILSFDVGGTSVKYALIDKGEIKKEDSFISKDDVSYLLEKMVSIFQENKSMVEGIALSMPGAVSPDGVIYGFSALPTIHGPNWINLLKEKCGVEISIENDANCAALAEVYYGNAKDCNDAIFLVIGSGIGGAVVSNRRIHHGKQLSGGEFGYTIMKFEDGRALTFSNLASTVSMVKKAQELKNDYTLDGKKVFSLANSGDLICRTCVDEFYQNLAWGIFNLQYSYDPDIILVSGAVSAQNDFINNINEKLISIQNMVEGANLNFNIDLCYFKTHANLIGSYVNFLLQRGVEF